MNAPSLLRVFPGPGSSRRTRCTSDLSLITAAYSAEGAGDFKRGVSAMCRQD